jgi:hypothetical protein
MKLLLVAAAVFLIPVVPAVVVLIAARRVIREVDVNNREKLSQFRAGRTEPPARRPG